MSSISGQVVHPTLEVTPIYSGFSSPVDLVHAGDGSSRLFVVERGGVIKVIKNGTTLSTPFLDIDSLVLSGGERGLLGLAFHPNYLSNGYFFINYTDNSGDTQISRYTRSASNPDVADVESKRLILNIHQTSSNHNGGCLRFSPVDSFLYIAMGDGGGTGDPLNNAQNQQLLLGKILRIDIDSETDSTNYAIPSDNPFIDDPTTLNEIWAIGLRNPWRFNFDRQTGDLWIGDVGQGSKEEVDFQAASSIGGENYGWRCYEGSNTYDTSGCGPAGSYDYPIFEYGRSAATGGWSITGGVVYRGHNECLQGVYVVADYGSENFWTILPDGAGWSTNRFKPSNVFSISAFGEDEAGEIYAVSLNGTIYGINGTSLTVDDDPINPGTYTASGIIESNGVIPAGNTVTFQAGGSIQLNADFEVIAGAEFIGELGCFE
ncbi:MAG: glucose dehydrogenase [Saprospiraceae bacterium]|nr:glucose dehydrogenase [Saprospiraceae bacterium]